MMTKADNLDHVINPTHRKGATQEHIYADNEKARMTARLMGAKSPKDDLRVARQESGK